MNGTRKGPGARVQRSRIATSSALSARGHMWYACKRPLPERRTATRSRGNAPDGANSTTKGGASRRLTDHKEKPRRWRDAVSEFRAGWAANIYLTVCIHQLATQRNRKMRFFGQGPFLPPAAPGQTSDKAMTAQVSGVPEGPAATHAPSSFPALDPTRWTGALTPAARPAGRDPAAQDCAARHGFQHNEGRRQTQTTA